MTPQERVVEILAVREYLGDGVYAHHDGYQIWLTTLEGSKIALEPEVFHSLVDYHTRTQATIKAWLAEQNDQKKDR